MAHKCKCPICGKEFDRDKIQAVIYSARRYAHATCYPEGEPVPMDLKGKTPDQIALEDYIKQLFNINKISPKINKQLKQFIEEYEYSYSGILKTLKWWYEIKKQDISKAYGGIGIVPYIYQDAYQYYFNIAVADFVNQQKTEEDFKEKVYEVNIDEPYLAPITQKLFNLEEEEE